MSEDFLFKVSDDNYLPWSGCLGINEKVMLMCNSKSRYIHVNGNYPPTNYFKERPQTFLELEVVII